MNRPPRLILPAAILFDMDGTLTQPMLDFARIKAELGIGSRPILEAIAEMSPSEQRAAEKIVERHEAEAARRSVLNPGCPEVLGWLKRRRITTAVITRNSRQCAAIVLRRHRLSIGVVITRQDGPYKPSPAPVLAACRRLGASPSKAWMVGDGQYDVEAANAAGAAAVWLSHGKAKSFAAQPWKTVADLHELLELLKSAG
ncbi:MAG: HAD family hydrolase [Tepidisphaeraceae bacterium]